MSVTAYGVVESDINGRTLQEYKFVNISRCGVDENSKIFFVEVEGRTKIFVSEHYHFLLTGCQDQINLLSLKKGTTIQFNPSNLIDLINERNLKYSRTGSAVSTFDVSKITRRSSRPVSRQLHINEEYILEKDSSGFQYVSYQTVCSVYAIVRSWTSPREFTIEYTHGTSRTYSSGERDTLLATLLDVCHAVGNVKVIVTGEISDNLRLIPRHTEENYHASMKDNFFGASSIESWLLSRLILPLKARTDSARTDSTAIGLACAELNANVPCPGISVSTDLNSVKNALVCVLTTLYNEVNVAYADELEDNSRLLVTLLQTLYRIIPCMHGYKCFLEVKEIDTRLLLLKLLKIERDFVRYWTLEVMSVLCRCPLLPRNIQQEFVNKHTLLTDAMLKCLIDLMTNKTDPGSDDSGSESVGQWDETERERGSGPQNDNMQDSGSNSNSGGNWGGGGGGGNNNNYNGNNDASNNNQNDYQNNNQNYNQNSSQNEINNNNYNNNNTPQNNTPNNNNNNNNEDESHNNNTNSIPSNPAPSAHLFISSPVVTGRSRTQSIPINITTQNNNIYNNSSSGNNYQNSGNNNGNSNYQNNNNGNNNNSNDSTFQSNNNNNQNNNQNNNFNSTPNRTYSNPNENTQTRQQLQQNQQQQQQQQQSSSQQYSSSSYPPSKPYIQPHVRDKEKDRDGIETVFFPNSLVIVSSAALLESIVCSRKNTSSPELFSSFLNLLAEKCEILIHMLRSTSFLIIENASILMFILLKNRNISANYLKELALSECLTLKHFYNAIYSPSGTQRFISRFLVNTWLSGSEKNNPGKAMLLRMIPSGLVEYLKHAQINDEHKIALDEMEDEFYNNISGQKNNKNDKNSNNSSNNNTNLNNLNTINFSVTSNSTPVLTSTRANTQSQSITLLHTPNIFTSTSNTNLISNVSTNNLDIGTNGVSTNSGTVDLQSRMRKRIGAVLREKALPSYVNALPRFNSSDPIQQHTQQHTQHTQHVQHIQHTQQLNNMENQTGPNSSLLPLPPPPSHSHSQSQLLQTQTQYRSDSMSGLGSAGQGAGVGVTGVVSLSLSTATTPQPPIQRDGKYTHTYACTNIQFFWLLIPLFSFFLT